MSARRKVLRGSAIVAASEAVAYGVSFLRNMILARLLTKADFGVAATFAMMITLLEFSAKLGIARFIVRDKEGDEPTFQGAAHLVQAVSGMISSLLMLAVSAPMAIVFRLPDQKWAMATLAFIPLILGFCHLDVRRYERKLNFGPSSYIEMISQIVITLLAWPLAKYFGDFRVVLCILILKATLNLVSSHLLAERPYRWNLHREYVTRMLRFGWPLIVNGFLMFCLVRGDQFVIARFFTMAELGAYAAAAALTVAPTQFFSRVFASVMLPVMSKAQDDPVLFKRRFSIVMAGICAFAGAYSTGAILAGEALMQFAYGQKYHGTGYLLAWLTAANTFRTVRLATAVAAMAKGDSKNEMLSNFTGGGALLLAFLAAHFQLPLWCIAVAGLIGEIFACMLSFQRLKKRDGVPLLQCYGPAFLVLLTMLAAGSAAYFGSHQLPFAVGLSAGVGAALLGGAFVGLVLPASRRQIVEVWAKGSAQGWKKTLSRRAPAVAPTPSSQ